MVILVLQQLTTVNTANCYELLCHRAIVLKHVDPPRKKPPGSATVMPRLLCLLFALPAQSGTLLQAGKRSRYNERPKQTPTVSMKAANLIMGVVTSLARVPKDAPSSMMHGAAMLMLHITPLSSITPMQQFSFEQAEGGVACCCQIGRCWGLSSIHLLVIR